jgi:hypothetical protein
MNRRIFSAIAIIFPNLPDTQNSQPAGNYPAFAPRLTLSSHYMKNLYSYASNLFQIEVGKTGAEKLGKPYSGDAWGIVMEGGAFITLDRLSSGAESCRAASNPVLTYEKRWTRQYHAHRTFLS